MSRRGDPFEITALLQGLNVNGKSATIELLEKGPSDPQPNVVDSKSVVMVDGSVSEAKFERSSTDGGSYEYTLKARIPDLAETRKTTTLFHERSTFLIAR